MTVAKKKFEFWVLQAFFIAHFLLVPGIRGYQDWQIHEYLLFVLLPIIWIIFFCKKDSIQNQKVE